MSRSMHTRWILQALPIMITSLMAIAPAAAQQSLRDQTSLGLVPADVAFYTALLNNRQQYEVFVQSKAFERLQEIPLVQMAKMQIQQGWENPPDPQIAAIKQWLAREENQELKDILLDALSHEIFLYGTSDFGDAIALINRLNNVSNMAQLESLQTGQPQEEILSRRLLEILNESPEQLRVPDLVIGFKLENPERAGPQLKRLREELEGRLNAMPELKQSLTDVQIDGHDYLSLQLKGSQLPWDQLSQEQLEKEQFKQLVDKVKQMTFTITVGLREQYFIVSIGDNNDHLQQLGTGEALVTQEAIQPLLEFEGKTVTDIAYASEQFLQRASSVEQQMSDMKAMLQQLAALAELEEDVQKELAGDLDRFVEQLEQFVPEPGALSSIEYLTKRGYEGYTYDYSEHPYLDSSQRLPILAHVGQQSILFVASRQKPSPEGYELVAEFLQRAAYYGEKIALEKLQEREQQTFQKLKEALQPLAERWDRITREKLAQAFADGQTALVVEAELTSKQWHQQMPESPIPLPILEIAIVCGVSDAEAAREAFAGYFRALQEALERVREAIPERLPQVSLPRPEILSVTAGTLYKYALPKQWGLDEQIALSGGLSDDFFVFSYSPSQATRLLNDEPLEVDGGPLADLDRNLGAASRLDFQQFVAVSRPWVDYAIIMSTGGASDTGAPTPAAQAIQEQAHALLEVLSCWRGYSSVSYLEDDVLVTQHEYHFEDLQ